MVAMAATPPAKAVSDPGRLAADHDTPDPPCGHGRNRLRPWHRHGGTKIAIGVVTSDGRILRKAAAPTPEDQDHLVQHVLAAIEDLRHDYPDVVAVGVGAAGMIDWPTGHIRWGPNNSSSDLPLQQLLLTEGSGLPAVVENDANAAAWAEAVVGAGAGLSNIIALTIGTGIGAGIILNGELQRGETGIAGEAGHAIISPFDPQLVILGGGLVTTGDLLLTPTHTNFERLVFARPHRQLPALALAQLGREAGLIGAALLALRRCTGPRRLEPVPEAVPG
jgi:predicted NBD/HSP70 family sugar kinase